MVALVSVETVLLVLLVVLVAGLLRSHAEILRRLGPADGAIPEPSASHTSVGAPAAQITGTTLEGDAVRLDLSAHGGPPTLLAFLSSGCSTCAGFWRELAEKRAPAGTRTVIVAHGPDRERPVELRSLARPGVPVVLSSAAWEDYRVPGAPYFVLVDGTIRGEGSAPTWDALVSLLTDALEDQRNAGVDEAFAAAGIAPNDESLYPAGRD